MAQTQTVSGAQVLAWVGAGNFAIEGRVVGVEEVQESLDLARQARAAYLKATTPAEEAGEKKARKAPEGKTCVYLVMRGKEILSRSPEFNVFTQRKERADYEAEIKESAEMIGAEVISVTYGSGTIEFSDHNLLDTFVQNLDSLVEALRS